MYLKLEVVNRTADWLKSSKMEADSALIGTARHSLSQTRLVNEDRAGKDSNEDETRGGEASEAKVGWSVLRIRIYEPSIGNKPTQQ
jgi:hypothetical protein